MSADTRIPPNPYQIRAVNGRIQISNLLSATPSGANVTGTGKGRWAGTTNQEVESDETQPPEGTEGNKGKGV